MIEETLFYCNFNIKCILSNPDPAAFPWEIGGKFNQMQLWADECFNLDLE